MHLAWCCAHGPKADARRCCLTITCAGTIKGPDGACVPLSLTTDTPQPPSFPGPGWARAPLPPHPPTASPGALQPAIRVPVPPSAQPHGPSGLTAAPNAGAGAPSGEADDGGQRSATGVIAGVAVGGGVVVVVLAALLVLRQGRRFGTLWSRSKPEPQAPPPRTSAAAAAALSVNGDQDRAQSLAPAAAAAAITPPTAALASATSSAGSAACPAPTPHVLASAASTRSALSSHPHASLVRPTLPPAAPTPRTDPTAPFTPAHASPLSPSTAAHPPQPPPPPSSPLAFAKPVRPRLPLPPLSVPIPALPLVVTSPCSRDGRSGGSDDGAEAASLTPARMEGPAPGSPASRYYSPSLLLSKGFFNTGQPLVGMPAGVPRARSGRQGRARTQSAPASPTRAHARRAVAGAAEDRRPPRQRAGLLQPQRSGLATQPSTPAVSRVGSAGGAEGPGAARNRLQLLVSPGCAWVRRTVSTGVYVEEQHPSGTAP